MGSISSNSARRDSISSKCSKAASAANLPENQTPAHSSSRNSKRSISGQVAFESNTSSQQQQQQHQAEMQVVPVVIGFTGCTARC